MLNEKVKDLRWDDIPHPTTEDLPDAPWICSFVMHCCVGVPEMLNLQA
jgi:hypothetical protein